MKNEQLSFSEYSDLLYHYAQKLEARYHTGKTGHKKYYKSLSKLDEWEDQFIAKFGYTNSEEEDEEEEDYEN